MNEKQMVEKIQELRNNPEKFINMIEETSGQKFYWYQKLYLKYLLKKKSR